MRLVVGSAIDVGQRRSENQDHLYSWTGGAAGLYIVADGMGGLRDGGLASELAIQTLTTELGPLVEEVARTLAGDTAPRSAQGADGVDPAADGETTGQVAPEDEAGTTPSTTGSPAVVAPLFTSLMDSVAAAIDKTNRSILRHAREHPDGSGPGAMGSTVTMVVVAGSLGIVANLGDSRIYLVREGAISRLTQDHSLVATLVAMGQISDDEAYTHPQRNLVYRSLGSDSDAEPDISVQRLQPGDTLILCSDGLWEMVRDDAILAALNESSPDNPREAADRLVALANRNGGEDNISLIIVQVRQD